MKIKAKLYIGLAFLFTLILLLMALGTYYINRLSIDTEKIIAANYESLEYSKNMIAALDEMALDKKSSFEKFESNLKLQEGNISEVGEKEITAELIKEYKNLFPDSINDQQKTLIRQHLYKIIDINLQAIARKNELARKSAKSAIMYMSFIGAVAVLTAFTFIMSFPGYIADPLNELTDSIKEIARKNYAQRVHFKSSGEFGELGTAFNFMARELEKYENSNLAQIIFQKKRIETIINTMHDPIIGLDENNTVLFVNGQALMILGIEEKEITGKYAPDVALYNDLLRVLLANEPNGKPLKIFAEGKESYFSKEILKIKTEDKLVGQVIILKNITQFKELDTAKTNFIATISHELKTPIASIKMSLKLLEDERVGKINEEQKKLITNIKDDSQRLLSITGELLDLTQVESGNIQLHYKPTHPKEVVDYAWQAMKFPAEQKGIKMEVNVEDNLPDLNIDLEKTAWVLVNFISNAIRYSPENGKIIISIKRDRDRIAFSVQDFGKGIDEKYLEKVFDKFFRIPGDGSPAGTGLGLTISKDFIQAQQGSIRVQSELNKGSTFIFDLPVQQKT